MNFNYLKAHWTFATILHPDTHPKFIIENLGVLSKVRVLSFPFLPANVVVEVKMTGGRSEFSDEVITKQTFWELHFNKSHGKRSTETVIIRNDLGFRQVST